MAASKNTKARRPQKKSAATKKPAGYSPLVIALTYFFFLLSVLFTLTVIAKYM